MGGCRSWFLLQESQLFLASRQELLECCVCGLENGATVSTGLPLPAESPHPCLQQCRPPERPCPLPATHGSPSGLRGEGRGQGHLAF